MKRVLTNLSRPVVWLCVHIPHVPGVKRQHVHCTVGAVIGIGGVVLTKSVHHPFALHIVADFIGYGLHAVGIAPILKALHVE